VAGQYLDLEHKGCRVELVLLHQGVRPLTVNYQRVLDRVKVELRPWLGLLVDGQYIGEVLLCGEANKRYRRRDHIFYKRS
jgi:hypothetical protein